MYKFIKIKKSNNCLICYKPLYSNHLFFFQNNRYICVYCLSKFKKINQKCKIDGINYYFLYAYDDFAKELVYKYKGCYDYMLKDVFYDLIPLKLRFLFFNKMVMFPPSSKEDDKLRGFNHMQEIAKSISSHHKAAFYKTCQYKQSDHHFNERGNIATVIRLKAPIKEKNLILIDDIFTSGSTIKTLISLLGQDKRITVIIFFKVGGQYNG